VDTVGAGDAFNGALATALAGGLDLQIALEAAVEAGALACTGPGARQALPRATDIGILRQVSARSSDARSNVLVSAPVDE